MSDDDLRATVEQLAERVDDLEDELEDERERRREVEDKLESLEKRVGHLMDDVIEVETQISETREIVESIDATGAGEGTVDLDGVEEGDATPLEQVCALPEGLAREQLDTIRTRSVWRARQIARNWEDYAERTPRGPLLRNRDLLRVLTALEDGKVEDTNVGKRVMQTLEDMSHGAFQREKRTAKNEWVVVLHEPERIPSLTSDDAVVSEGG